MLLTRQQREALKAVYDRQPIYRLDDNPATYGRNEGQWPDHTTAHRVTYRELRRTVQHGPGCAMVPWLRMWLGVEPDGHTHS